MPRPLCHCKNCHEARAKGIPFARTSPAIYIEDEAIIFDTPEDIRWQIEREKVKAVKHIFYTHWHPDHTGGWRLVEQINGVILGQKRKPAINVYIPQNDIENFKKHCDGLFFMEKLGYIHLIKFEDRQPIKIGSLTIIPFDFHRPDRIRYGFKIKQKNKSMIYAPCSIYQMKTDHLFKDLDLLMIEKGWFGSPAKTRKSLPARHAYQDHVAFEENLSLIKQLKPKHTLLTHISGTLHHEEEMGHENLTRLCQKYPDLHLEPSFDGMKIKL